MKKVLLVLLAVLTVFSLCACDDFFSNLSSGTSKETVADQTSGDNTNPDGGTPGQGEEILPDVPEVGADRVLYEEMQEGEIFRMTVKIKDSAGKNDYITLESFVDLVYLVNMGATDTSFADSLKQGVSWTVNGKPASAKTPVRDGDVVEYTVRSDEGGNHESGDQNETMTKHPDVETVPPEDWTDSGEKPDVDHPGVDDPNASCAHEWKEGYCHKCDSVCSHKEWDDQKCCTVCGMPMGVELISITVIENGEEVFRANQAEAVIGDLLYSWYGRSFRDLSREFVITLNGEEILDEAFVITERCKIELTTREGGDVEEEHHSYEVYCVYYDSFIDEEGKLHWINQTKDFYVIIQDEYPHLHDLLYGVLCVDLQGGETIYVNGEKVDRTAGYFFKSNARNYIAILDADIPFEPFDITVKDETGVFGDKTLHFEAPVFWQEIVSLVFGDVDFKGFEYTFSCVDEEAAYLPQAIAVECVMTISYQKTHVTVIAPDEKNELVSTVYSVAGPLPTLEKFVAEQLGIKNLTEYYFCDEAGKEIPLDCTEYRTFYAFSKKLLSESFAVTYRVEAWDGNLYQGEFNATRPMRLADILDLAIGAGLDYNQYQLIINDEIIDTSMDSAKNAYGILIWQGCTVELSKAITVFGMVDGDQPRDYQLKFVDFDALTVGDVATALGVNFGDYEWKFAWSSEILHAEMLLKDLVVTEPYLEIWAHPKKIHMSVTVYDRDGGENSFEINRVGMSMTLSEVAELAGVAYDDYLWYYAGIDDSTPLPSDFVFTYDSHGITEMRYLKAVSKEFRVEIMITDMNSINVSDNKYYTAPITVGALLQSYGYEWSRVEKVYNTYFMTELYEDTVIDTFMSLQVFLIYEETVTPEQPVGTLTYDVLLENGEQFVSSYQFFSVGMLAELLDMAGVSVDFGLGYRVTVNGAVIEDSYSKGAYFLEISGDCTVEIRPTIKIALEGDLSTDCLYYTPADAPTFGRIAEDFGVNFDDYVWTFFEGVEVTSEDSIYQYCGTDDYFYHTIRVTKRAIEFSIYCMDENGVEMHFHTEGKSELMHGVTLEEVAKAFGLDVYAFTWEVTDLNAGGAYTTIDPTYVFKTYSPGYDVTSSEERAHYVLVAKPLKSADSEGATE
ncbi:MAG: hypothetical protein IJW50_07880 [Clostridia bacterium]|nr:hypothetical protein [Clostridia bacterium]